MINEKVCRPFVLALSDFSSRQHCRQTWPIAVRWKGDMYFWNCIRIGRRCQKTVPIGPSAERPLTRCKERPT
jgi:hypothetical protein